MLGENFDFTYFRPGEWNIKVYRSGLHKRCKITSEEFKLNLKTSTLSVYPLSSIVLFSIHLLFCWLGLQVLYCFVFDPISNV